jgi:hypothetical protein
VDVTSDRTDAGVRFFVREDGQASRKRRQCRGIVALVRKLSDALATCSGSEGPQGRRTFGRCRNHPSRIGPAPVAEGCNANCVTRFQ